MFWASTFSDYSAAKHCCAPAAAFGDAFLARGKRLGLIVPSAVIPEASNIVVNPRHPRMAGVRVEIVRDFAYDPRLRP
jgi:RES domain-containing protein